MMAIMFDLHRENMKMIRKYVNDSFASKIVEEYDWKMTLPQLC
jgi:hypothetical protein